MDQPSWTAIRDGQFLGLVRGRAKQVVQALGIKNLIQPPVNLFSRSSRDRLQNICRDDAKTLGQQFLQGQGLTLLHSLQHALLHTFRLVLMGPFFPFVQIA